MKKLTVILVAIACLIAAPAFAKKAEINLSMHETMAASGTSPFYIRSMSTDVILFGKIKDLVSGSSDYILYDKGEFSGACWSMQVISATTTGGNSTIDIGYKVINAEPTTANWTAAPLIRVMKGVATDSGVSRYAVSFNPMPGKYLRFYVTSGTTPFSSFEAVAVAEEGKCESQKVHLGGEVISVGTSTAVGLSSVPADCVQAVITPTGDDIRWRVDGTSPTSTVGPSLVEGDYIMLESKVQIDAFKGITISTGSGSSIYAIYYGIR